MHKILFSIAVLGVAATVGAVVAVKNNENLRNKAGDVASKAKDAADKAISKAKSAADSLAKTVKDLGKGSSVDADDATDSDDDADVDADDDLEDAPEHENADCLSLDDIISPEAKEYVGKLREAFSSAEKAFSSVMNESKEGTAKSESAVSEGSPVDDVDLDAVDDVPDETDEAQIMADEPAEGTVDAPAEASASEMASSSGDTSEDTDEIPGFTPSDDEDVD